VPKVRTVTDIIFSNELQDSLFIALQNKYMRESKVITARAEVESASLIRQAADILSSAPAIQIRYLEAVQTIAKTANSKVIFLPATNQTVHSHLALLENSGDEKNDKMLQGVDAFQEAISVHFVETI
jgi:regulator of protease activity HflC (stomatin/prohibitin superfamily)